MNLKDMERLESILKRLRRTQPQETICLMHWEIKLILDYITELRTRKEAQK